MKAFARRKVGRPKVKRVIGGEVYQGFREAMSAPQATYSRNFVTYLSHLGDAEKAAVVLKISPDTLRRQAKEGGWDEKVTTLLEVREKDGQHAFAKQLNRLINLTQVVRVRTVIDMVLKHICEDEASFRDFLTIPTKAGRAFSAKALLEITKAMQACQAASYAALADQTTERIFDKKEGRDSDSEAPQLGVFKALTQLSHATQPDLPQETSRDEPSKPGSTSKLPRNETGQSSGGSAGEPTT